MEPAEVGALGPTEVAPSASAEVGAVPARRWSDAGQHEATSVLGIRAQVSLQIQRGSRRSQTGKR
eukprot:1588293-Alexandrium_andersonii.AAC.1